MSNQNAWLPLYVADYLADTMTLSAREHGAYLLLLMEYWRRGPLPDDDRALAAVTRLPVQVWRRSVGPSIRRFFTLEADGLLHQARMDRERGRASDLSAKRRAASGARSHRRGGKSAAPPPDPPAPVNSKPTANQQQTLACARGHARVVHSQSSSFQSEDTPSLRCGGRGAPGPAPLSAKEALWSEGLPLLQRLTGKPRRSAARLMGQLVKLARDDCDLVRGCIGRAEQARPGEVVPWLTGAVRASQRGAEERIAQDWNLRWFNEDALAAMEAGDD